MMVCPDGARLSGVTGKETAMSDPRSAETERATERETKRVLVVQPDAKDDLGRLGPWLEAEGMAVEVIRPFLGEPVPSRAAADALVVLGGSMGVTDRDAYPWLARIESLLSDAVARSLPALGICLGAQLLATASGGRVRRGARGLECGVVAVRWLESAAADPLVGEQEEPLLAATMHFDAIERLPAGAVLLGSGDTYPHQVFRVGRAWGLQFHPEVAPERFASWRSELDPGGRAAYDEHARKVREADAVVREHARGLVRRFGAIVRGDVSL